LHNLPQMKLKQTKGKKSEIDCPSYF